MADQSPNKALDRTESGADGRIEPRPTGAPNSDHVQIYRRINLLVLAIALAVCLAVGLTIWSAIMQDDITRSQNLSLANAAIATDRASHRPRDGTRRRTRAGLGRRPSNSSASLAHVPRNAA